MKKIFIDMCNSYLFSVFIDLINEQKNKAYFSFVHESEEENSDIVILNSFDELINFENIFKKYITDRIIKNNPVIFIIETICTRGEKSCRNFIQVSDSIYVCDSESIAELISTMLPKLVILPEIMMAEKPIIVSNLDSKMSLFMEMDNYTPVFDDDL